jgi:hypothetical protein
LPADTIAFLLGSRYCETDRLSDIAWQLFAGTPPGWAHVHVQAICDYVHRHIAAADASQHEARRPWPRCGGKVFNASN